MKVNTVQTIQKGIALNLGENVPETFGTWQGDRLTLSEDAMHFGFVYSGTPTLYRCTGEQDYKLYPGMYFSLPGGGWIGSDNSSGFVITCPNHSSMFHIGGAIESIGRFAYIDGGTDSLLIPPIISGDPCLNALYFPPAVKQTAHTHPSYRIVMIVEGSGECETSAGIIPLHPETILFIPANSVHGFRTANEPLTAVCFHPDSDTGFTQIDHPMLKRTIVEGISASQLPEIQTATLSKEYP